MKKTIEIDVDLPLLIEQKQAVLRAIGLVLPNDKDSELLQGALNLLDYVHDELDPPEARS